LHRAGNLKIQSKQLSKEVIELEMATNLRDSDVDRLSTAKDLRKKKAELLGVKLDEQKISLRIAQHTEASKITQDKEDAQKKSADALRAEVQLSDALYISSEKKKQATLKTLAMDMANKFREDTNPARKQILAARLAKLESEGVATGVGDNEMVTITNYHGYNDDYEINFGLYKDLVGAINGGVADGPLLHRLVTLEPRFAQKAEDAQEVIDALREMLEELPAYTQPEKKVSAVLSTDGLPPEVR
jgi:hypothetical protein